MEVARPVPVEGRVVALKEVIVAEPKVETKWEHKGEAKGEPKVEAKREPKGGSKATIGNSAVDAGEIRPVFELLP